MSLIDLVADHIGETYNTLAGNPKVANTKKAFGSSLPVRYGSMIKDRFNSNMATAMDPNLPYQLKPESTFGLAGLAMTGSLPFAPRGNNVVGTTMFPAKTLQKAQKLGFDTDTILYHGTSTPEEILSFDPAAIRSIFAKFNKKDFKSKDLLASGLLPFLLGSQVINSKENKQ